MRTPVVVRYIDMLKGHYLCHANSYQNAFSSSVNGFHTRGEAIKFAEANGCAVERHSQDPLQEDGK